MDGVLNINKPPGPTSFQIVSLIRRRSGERKVGHAGTLDPLAGGILPICLGQATKIVPFIMDFPKTYRAVIELGISTDTYDASGKIVAQKDPSFVSLEMVEEVLRRFEGEIWQRPPPFSAIKVKGRPLYSLARKGIIVEPPPRRVKIFKIKLLSWQPPFLSLEIECGKGTYVRSLAHDLGETLGCGAYVKETIRTRYGIFNLEQAITLPQLEEAFSGGNWREFLHSIDKVLSHFPAIILSKEKEKLLQREGYLPLTPAERPQIGEIRRAYTLGGSLLALIRFQGKVWKLEKLFR